MKAVILDRDGVLNVDSGHPWKIEDLILIEDSAEAIKLLNDHGFKVFVATNQSVIGRGICTRNDVVAFNTELKRRIFERSGGKITKIMMCPHAPDKDGKPTCKCRKPSTYMYRKLINHYGITPDDCYVVGDKLTDLIPADKLGLTPIQVLTGNESNELTEYTVCLNLMSAAKMILRMRGEI